MNKANGRIPAGMVADVKQLIAQKQAQEQFDKTASVVHDRLREEDPAHPVSINLGPAMFYEPGISKRDFFAAVVLQGLLSGGMIPACDADNDTFAKQAYRIASSMIEARKPYLPAKQQEAAAKDAENKAAPQAES